MPCLLPWQLMKQRKTSRTLSEDVGLPPSKEGERRKEEEEGGGRREEGGGSPTDVGGLLPSLPVRRTLIMDCS